MFFGTILKRYLKKKNCKKYYIFYESCCFNLTDRETWAWNMLISSFQCFFFLHVVQMFFIWIFLMKYLPKWLIFFLILLALFQQVEKICRHQAASMAAVAIRWTVSPTPRRRKVPYLDSKRNCVWSAVIELPVTTITPSPAKDAKVIWFSLKINQRNKLNWETLGLFVLFVFFRILPAEYNEKCGLPVQIRKRMRHWHVHEAKVSGMSTQKMPHGRHAARM